MDKRSKAPFVDGMLRAPMFLVPVREASVKILGISTMVASALPVSPPLRY
jgi:hypothetical protein